MSANGHSITTLEQLEALYGKPSGPAVAKEIDRIAPSYRALIEAAPFVAIATSGPEGLDCSPKGDAKGFVRILDERTFHCSKAIVRSKLWDDATRIDRKSLPSTGAIIADVSQGKLGGDAYDRELPERIKTMLY